MAAEYRNPNGEPDAKPEYVVIMRNARSGDRDFTHEGQVLVKFGDGAERAVDREALSGHASHEMPNAPPPRPTSQHKEPVRPAVKKDPLGPDHDLTKP